MHIFFLTLSLQQFSSSYLLLSAALAIAFPLWLSLSLFPSLYTPSHPREKGKIDLNSYVLSPFHLYLTFSFPLSSLDYHHIHALSSLVPFLSRSFFLFVPCFSFFVPLSTQPSRCYRNRSIWNGREWKLFLGNFPSFPIFLLFAVTVFLSASHSLSSSILMSLIHVSHCRGCCCHGHCRNLDTIYTQCGHGNLKGQHGKTKRPTPNGPRHKVLDNNLQISAQSTKQHALQINIKKQRLPVCMCVHMCICMDKHPSYQMK